MSADIKKPPVAPKPKFVIHPPVAPKPESLIGNVLQASKKPKPVIAPKPKVLKSSSFREPRTPSAFNKNASLEELKGNRSESLDFLNCKNGPSGEGHDGPSYIISMCTHKLGNGENLYNTRTVFEQLEKLSLENTEICRQPTPSPKTRWKRDTHDDRGTNANQIVLNSCVLETNVKNAFCRNILSNSCHFKHTDPHTDAQGNGSLCKSQEDLRRVSSDQSLSSSKECICKVNPSKLNGDVCELHKPGRSPKGCKKTACPTDQDHAGNCKTDNARTTPESVKDACPQAKPSDPSAKVQPVPKPRKLRVACLIRQDCIDSPGDGTSELVYSESRTVESAEPVLKKLTTINVLGESVSYQEEPRGTVNEEPISLHGGEGTSLIEVSAGLENSDLQKGGSLAATKISIVEENVDRALNQDQRCSPNLDDREDDSSDPGTVDKRSSFIRCCSLSMSLPKQLKITCNQHLSANSGFESTNPKKDSELPLKPEGSPRVAPKKPQRHSLPAAGPLKKAASEELVEKRCYVSNGEPNTQAVVNEIRLRHALAKEHSVSASHDLPTRTSEKPVWKLHRPILPFSCSPESLKASSSNEKSTFVTKPRAKSLSSVDMERIDKPNKDPPKKSTFKKLLNMKLSVCIMKSDFQRFLCKGSQSGDGSSDRLSSGEGKAGGQNVSSASPVDDRKTKPAKAQSADSCSPESQKKRLMDKCQLETSSRHRSGSLGDQPTFLVENPLDQPLNFVTNHCEVEYENLRHYDEIPEYENLPFTLHSDENTCYEWQNSSSVEDYDTTVYEMQDPYEGSERRLLYDSRSSEDDPAAELSIVHSDEEVVNSSDDEGSSSDSSKGDLDQLEDRLSKRAGKKTKVYHIAKEIMSSEKVFVDVLKLLHIDFRAAVAHASRQLGKSVIEDRTLNQILYYLPQLYELNRDVLRELEERMANWSDQQKIADIFVTKGPYLKMYSTYIREFEKNIALLDEQCRRNPSFSAVVKAFEMNPRCANLALKHYLLKPVQRIPQYRLLLTDYLKNILEESSDYRDTQAALAVVIEVANHANDIMKQGDNFQKLMQIQYSLNGHHEIVQPGRVFLKEGTLMKLSRKVMQPRMFFLFNDALLYSTPVQSGMYKLNNMLSLAGMKVRKPTQEAYQNELNIESVERSFILSASSATERDGWLEAISQAIEEYTKKRITFNPSKSLEEAEQEHEKEDSPLGTKAPIWIPDTRATMCMICTSEFTLTWRRHHCRACGKIVCQACSANKHSLEYLKNQPERVCDHCYGELLKQDHQTALKTGSPGNHKSPSSALSTVLQNIPSVRKMKKIPAALKEVSASTEDSSMSGYLYRSKGQKKPWKHLWFVIKNKVLYTYAASEDVAALESQPLLGFTVTEVKDETSESRVFQLLHKNTLFYVFKADDQHSTERWLEAFQEATVL
ncbi:FYVE, RhoGEF and PH domain-containing protein 6 isoform X2 [Ambystoma mexicanum]|uniref:FYVE, RhoGEF and PH domain-containing protein 6 isoform X2 n=1 Tax=Ambystoma mexicanum TaxID=8296 RepID=UPI0037E8D909